MHRSPITALITTTFPKPLRRIAPLISSFQDFLAHQSDLCKVTYVFNIPFLSGLPLLARAFDRARRGMIFLRTVLFKAMAYREK